MAKIEKPIIGNPYHHRWHREDIQHLLERVSRYTRFVSVSKLLLGGMALLMIGTIVIVPMLNSGEEGLRLAFSNIPGRSEATPIMTNPTFQGVDEQNQPYFVTADSALQQDEHTILLNNVQGDMLSEQQNWLSVKAEKGRINNTEKRMQLSGNVRLYHQEGYEFRTEAVEVDMNARVAEGRSPVHGFGPVGEIDAAGFVWDHDARSLRFTGGVKMTIVNTNG